MARTSVFQAEEDGSRPSGSAKGEYMKSINNVLKDARRSRHWADRDFSKRKLRKTGNRRDRARVKVYSQKEIDECIER